MSAPAEGRRGLAGSAALMFSGTLVSRLLGLVRNIVLVAAIGVSGAANSFSVANKLPNVVYMLVAGGVLNAILVPQIVRAMKGRDGGDEYVNRLLTMAGAALLGLTTLLTAGASVLVAIYASELDARWFTLAVTFAIWCVPQLFFYGMYTLLGQVLNARGVFGPYMWAPAVNNLVAIIGLVAYIVLFGGTATGAHLDPAAWTGARIAVIAGTATIGVAVQAAVLVIPLHRSGFRFRPRWGLRGSGLGRASRVATWAFASLAVAQLGFIAISNLAAGASSAMAARGVSAVAALPHIAAQSGFVPGNAAWDNANFLYMLPQSLITVSLVTALFTRVSSYAANGDLAAVRTDLSLGLRTIAVFTVFAGGALAVVALPLVQAVLPTTTLGEAEGIARVVVALLAGIAALGAFTMIQRVYYAFEDTRSLFRLQVPLTVIVIVGCLASTILPPNWWLVGAAVATTLSNIVGSVVAYLALRLKLPSLDGRRVLRTHLRLVLAATPAILLGWGLLHLVGPAALSENVAVRTLQALGRVAVIGLVMTVVYVLLLRVLQVSELQTMVRPVASMLGTVGSRLPQPMARWTVAVAGRLGGGGAVRTMSGHNDTSRPDRHEGSRTLDRHSEHPAPTLPPDTVLAGRYRLERELDPMLPGTALWRGHDQILDREVNALVLPEVSGASLETLDAARRAALVDDPRLQRILDVGEEGQFPYIVTDVPNGPSLADLAAEGTLAPDVARAVVGEAASALEAARRRGVHHLALTPAAIHLMADGQVKIAGIGVAAAYLGLNNEDPVAAARTDAIGLVRLLYVALTGHWPTGDAAADATRGPGMADSHLPDAPLDDGDTVAPRTLRADVPADLDAVCRQTLQGDPDGPRTPSELIRELAPWHDINAEALTQPGAASVAAGEVSDVSTDEPAPSDQQPDDDGDSGAQPDEATAQESVTPGTAAAAGASGAGSGLTTGAAAGAAGAAIVGAVTAGSAAVASPAAKARPAWVTVRSDDTTDGSHDAPTQTPAPEDHDAPAAPPEPPAPVLDASDWQPRPLAPHSATTAFSDVVTAGEDVAGDADIGVGRHQRGSAVLATLGAAVGGAAATVASAARSAVEAVDQRVTQWRADREERSEAAEDAQREADVQAALEAQEAAENAPTPSPSSTASWVTDAPTPPPAVIPVTPQAEQRLRPDGSPVPFRERRLDPTPIVLAIAFVAVILGAILAVRTLFADAEPVEMPTRDATEVTAPATDGATPDAGTPSATPTPEPTTAPAAPPVIVGLAPLDPEGDGAENPDLTGRALDGDPTSYWRSRSYVDPQYGMKSGIGLSVELKEETVVSSVGIDLMGEGGNVEIRVTDPATPTEGDVLASGAMGPDSTFTLSEPVTTDHIVLWFTALPVADSDGRNRLEIAELTVE